MNHAERCPVCNGFGHIAFAPFGVEGASVVGPTQVCHGCGGKGWVIVPDKGCAFCRPEVDPSCFQVIVGEM